jgi:rhodanese-related sulfurtransferase
MDFKIRKINTEQLQSRLKRDRPFMLVDVRDKEAFMKGHIPGASNMFDGEIMPMVKSLDKGTDIIVYGPGIIGQTRLCDDAAEKFMNIGSRYIYAYDEGLKGWVAAGNRVNSAVQKMT